MFNRHLTTSDNIWQHLTSEHLLHRQLAAPGWSSSLPYAPCSFEVAMKSHSFEILPRKKQGKPRQTKQRPASQSSGVETPVLKLRTLPVAWPGFAVWPWGWIRSDTHHIAPQKWHCDHLHHCVTLTLPLYALLWFISRSKRRLPLSDCNLLYMILQTHAKNRCLWIPHEISIDSLWCLYFHTIEMPSHTISNSSSDRIQPCAGLQCSVPPQGSTTWMTLSGLRTLQPDFNHETTHIKALFHEVLQQLSLWDSTVQSLSSERLGTRGKLCYDLAAFPCARAAKTVPVRSPSWYQP